MVSGHTLSKSLFAEAQRIEADALGVGLDFFEVVFEMLDAADVNAVAAYGGFPNRYASWRFGMDYERLQKGYYYGLSKIYELVISNDPTYAYLVRSNSLMEQKLVMAHVFGHADFFKHNVWFSPTERHMVEQMRHHSQRVREHMDRRGQDEVERFIDLALSLEGLIDPYLPLRDARRRERGAMPLAENHLDRARRSFEAAMGAVEDEEQEREVSSLPTYDILGFLADHAPLEPWRRDILQIIRCEAYYFMPQRMTKIMNEGWASFWHSRLLTTGILDASEIVQFADCHSGATATAPGQLNPYKVGIELFRHAEAAGKDIFKLRAVHNDVSFIDEVVDEEFAVRHGLFVYKKNERTGRTEIADRDWQSVKSQLLRDLSWGGQPQIQLIDESESDGSLVLRHAHDGRDLKLDEAGEIVRQIASLWRRPVHLLTLEDGNERRLTSDGEEVKLVDPKAAEEGSGEAQNIPA